jgi:hypothetical protein
MHWSCRESSIQNEEPLKYDVADDDAVQSRFTEWVKQTYSRHRRSAGDRKLMDWLSLFLPCLSWLSTYNVRPSDACLSFCATSSVYMYLTRHTFSNPGADVLRGDCWSLGSCQPTSPCLPEAGKQRFSIHPDQSIAAPAVAAAASSHQYDKSES